MTSTLRFLGLIVIVLALAALFQLPFVSRGPQIIVNLPQDAKPLAQLTQPGDKVIGPDRAVLWFTIFDRVMKAGWSGSEAANVADHAVKTVYGPTPPPVTPSTASSGSSSRP